MPASARRNSPPFTARTVTFGPNRISGLSPHGYWQGVFRMFGDDLAQHDLTHVTFSIPALERRLRS